MAENNTSNIGFEKQIWDAACVLRGNIDASEYKSVVLGLIFLKYMKLPNVAKFVYHFVKAKDLASMNAGSAVPSMTTDILNAMEVVIPSASALEEFESLVAPMYEAMEANDVQSKALSQMRDTLLPKLMSGEIDVSDIQL